MGISPPYTLATPTLHGHVMEFLGGNLGDLEKSRKFPIRKSHNITI